MAFDGFWLGGVDHAAFPSRRLVLVPVFNGTKQGKQKKGDSHFGKQIRSNGGHYMTPESILAVQGLHKTFGGVKALDGIDLQVWSNEILGLIGPNGAGKTALINTVTCYYRATCGSISLRGRDFTLFPLHEFCRLGIGRTFQTIRLFKRLTVLENVMVAFEAHVTNPLRALSGRSASAHARAMSLLD